ncbi:hypothetical protein P6P90_07670 [Ectobacillus antri]|jgi:hypothetical protein|uniref:Nucleotidyltransferase n=1 Tax=Ectobacillus antri TaxID=2486280 RepID=A0ABT6H3P5_9BACI|nr:hypothetical protein [Ectobacillus antri]MDG4657536.1 hypothetical protein [Ectobacillus antri]MDG5753849.1 hypothetical protein [Ectobacillus antri]
MRFMTITDEVIAEKIDAAREEVRYAAPAMSIIVAEALLRFVNRSGKVEVTLDCSANPYREGFGDLTALDLLVSCIPIADERDLRMGMLEVDGTTYSYVPVSKQNEHVQKNGIVHTAPLPPQAFVMSTAELRHELRRQPVPDFTMQKRLTAYRNMIQFAEISFSGGRLEKTTMKIPNHLLNIAKERGFEEKMKASYQLFDKHFSLYTKPMSDRVEQLRSTYTRTVVGYGNVILTEEKEHFLKALSRLKVDMETYTAQLRQEVAKQIQKTKQELVENFTPLLLINPPAELPEHLTEEQVRAYIDLLLCEEIPHVDEILKRIELHHNFKDMTEETLQDEEFYRQLEKAYRDREIVWPRHDLQQAEWQL